jgi:hypothetical protein
MITAETISRIIAFRGDGLPVVSLYVPRGARSTGCATRRTS